MGEARDIAGFIIPYTAGIFTAVIGAAAFGCLIVPIASTSSLIAAISLIIMLLPGRKHIHPVFTWMLTAIAGMSAGLRGGLTGILTSWSHTADTGWLAETALSFRLSLETVIDAIPFRDEDTSALLKALLTGNRESLPAHITDAFRASGASHILALSGLHLGIIYGILVKILGVLGNSLKARIIRSSLIISACGFYTMATGAGPSITRAFLFILLGEAARLTGRSNSLGHILAASLLIQLTFDPLSAGSVGFQLSYAAMAGIAFIFPRLKGLWPGSVFDDGIMTRCTRWIWEVCSMSISCQLATGALAWLYFRTLPKHFLLTNLLAIPLTGLIIPAIMITLILNEMGICPVFVLQTAEWMISTLIRVLEIIATMRPGPQTRNRTPYQSGD